MPPKENWREHTLAAHMKALEQNEVNTPKRRRQQKIIKLRTEINQVEIKRTIQRISKTRSWLVKKINKTDKPLARLNIGHRDSIKVNKIGNENEISQQIFRNFKNHQILLHKPIYSTQM